VTGNRTDRRSHCLIAGSAEVPIPQQSHSRRDASLERGTWTATSGKG
jgi:hypothetical protein